jgi:glutamyl-tRNA(Gln) amidotransferase subunit D
MSEKDLSGYKGCALEHLRKAGVEVGDMLRIVGKEESYEGILIPRSDYGDETHVIVKLRNGYNIGIEITPETFVEKIGKGSKPAFAAPPQPEQNPLLPKITIISTGGTIASRVDYRTGGVRPALSASDLYSVVPELAYIAQIDTQILYSVFSENLTCKQWTELANAIARLIDQKVNGVIVAHGTDTMGYTAAALSFALQNLPIPVIIVGSQRSADRPSSDAATNLIGAVSAAANAPFAEVAVAMHETTSDDSIVFHRGTKVRKCHTSSRDAFKTVNAEPYARIKNGQIEMLTEDYMRKGPEDRFLLKPEFNERAALIKFYPGMDSALIEWLVATGYKGIILEGTGLGHVNKRSFDAIQKAVEENVVVAMTSQCIWGRINMNVYDAGRDLLARGVVPLEDMLPETALVKLMWALAQAAKPQEVKDLLTKNIAGEISPRTFPS